MNPASSSEIEPGEDGGLDMLNGDGSRGTPWDETTPSCTMSIVFTGSVSCLGGENRGFELTTNDDCASLLPSGDPMREGGGAILDSSKNSSG